MSGSGQIWIEITNRDDRRGGGRWGFGHVLWSPSRDRGGGDRYQLMRSVLAGDRVLHFLRDSWGDGTPPETRIVGMSRARSSCREVTEEPPNAGDWSGRAPYYKIPLHGFDPFSAPIPVQQLLADYSYEIRRELTDYEPRHYPFSIRASDGGDELRTNRGMYLAQCTSGLYLMIRDALSINESDVLAPLSGSVHEDYAEARRLLRERLFFIRHRGLARETKRRLGYTCQGCGFSFSEAYGALGEEYIECHQLDADGTSSEDVTVLCANCHRMVHRRTPALTVDELRKYVSASRSDL